MLTVNWTLGCAFVVKVAAEGITEGESMEDMVNLEQEEITRSSLRVSDTEALES